MRLATLAAFALVAGPAALAAGDVSSMVLAGGRVSIDVPTGLALAVTPEQVLVVSSPPPCDPGFAYCFYLPKDAYVGTNLRSAGLSITRRTDLRSLTSCLLAQPDGWSGLQPAVVLGAVAGASGPAGAAGDSAAAFPSTTVATSRFDDVGEGAAGSYTLGDVLRLYDGAECWELQTRTALTRFENYPPGAILEFTPDDQREVDMLLAAVVDSVTVGGAAAVWPIAGSGDLSEFVRVELPSEATSPLTVTGLARGTWFSEGSFAVNLATAAGDVIATGLARAEGEWQTTALVPFTAELTFTVDGPTEAVLELHRDNPSGLAILDAVVTRELTLR